MKKKKKYMNAVLDVLRKNTRPESTRSPEEAKKLGLSIDEIMKIKNEFRKKG